MFNSIKTNLSGRWYNTSIKYNDIKWIDKKYQIIYNIPEWSNDNKILKNVPIKINFTKEGYNKIKSIFL